MALPWGSSLSPPLRGDVIRQLTDDRGVKQGDATCSINTQNFGLQM